MTRDLLICVVVAVVGVALRRPVTEVYKVPDVRIQDGEIRVHCPPIVDFHNVLRRLTVEVILHINCRVFSQKILAHGRLCTEIKLKAVATVRAPVLVRQQIRLCIGRYKYLFCLTDVRQAGTWRGT